MSESQVIRSQNIYEYKYYEICSIKYLLLVILKNGSHINPFYIQIYESKDNDCFGLIFQKNIRRRHILNFIVCNSMNIYLITSKSIVLLGNKNKFLKEKELKVDIDEFYSISYSKFLNRIYILYSETYYKYYLYSYNLNYSLVKPGKIINKIAFRRGDHISCNSMQINEETNILYILIFNPIKTTLCLYDLFSNKVIRKHEINESFSYLMDVSSYQFVLGTDSSINCYNETLTKCKKISKLKMSQNSSILNYSPNSNSIYYLCEDSINSILLEDIHKKSKVTILIFRIISFDKSRLKLKCEIKYNKTSDIFLLLEIESTANHLSEIFNEICNKTDMFAGEFVLVTKEKFILTQTYIYDYLKITDSKTSILESYKLETLIDKKHIPFDYLRYIAKCKNISINIGREKLIYNLITKNYNHNYNNELELSLANLKNSQLKNIIYRFILQTQLPS